MKKIATHIENLFIASIAVFILAVVAWGIKSAIKEKETKANAETYLVYVGKAQTKNSLVDIYYDKDTKVMYIVNYSGGTTVMVNPDGSPRLYKEDNDD